MPFNIGPGELILILVIALVVLGPGKLPDVAQSLGKSIREFRKAATDVSDAGRLDTPAAGQAVATASPPAPPAPPIAVAPAADAPAPPVPAADPAPAGTEPANDPSRS